MPDVRAFRGLLYSSESRDVTPLVAPPYDVLDESRRDAYLQKSPFTSFMPIFRPKGPRIKASGIATSEPSKPTKVG